MEETAEVTVVEEQQEPLQQPQVPEVVQVVEEDAKKKLKYFLSCLFR